MFNFIKKKEEKHSLTKNLVLSKDEIAKILRISPEMMDAFEKTYENQVLNKDAEDFFSTNAKQAAKAKKLKCDAPQIKSEKIDNIVERIVNELLIQTERFIYDGNQKRVEKVKVLNEELVAVTPEEIMALEENIRPDLTGNHMKVDISAPSYPGLLYLYNKFLTEKTEKTKKLAYDLFRQGLDILDLDEITYKIIATNPTTMGYWLPPLIDACHEQGFFKIPKTTIVKVPITLLQLTRQDYQSLSSTTMKIVNEWAMEAFKIEKNKEYFIKTGTYSSKFDFRNAYIHDCSEAEEIGSYLLYIHFAALRHAGPTMIPCIYGMSTTTEWVVREFIHDKESNPCIYQGLPLHTEYRVFIDTETKEVLSCCAYWDPETMKKRFGHEEDSDAPQNIHDYIIYSAHEETLMKRYEENKELVSNKVKQMLPYLDLPGQWSLDIMQNGQEFYLIDMAPADISAYCDSIPTEKRKTFVENWIPELN